MSTPARYLLWPENHPTLADTSAQDIPTLTVFPVDTPKAACILILPGGGYQALAPHEADPIALWLNTLGITGIVLRYRRAPLQHPIPFMDASRAMRMVRARASEWDIDPHRVGILGSSAGGHLAATVSTQFDSGELRAENPIDRHVSRPDLTILMYPVITLQDPFAHVGSRLNLLGKNAPVALIEKLSADKNVSAQTPPAFLFHTVDDSAVPVENSLMYAEALRQKQISFEMHLYEHGEHGVGLAQSDPVLSSWPSRCADWLGRRGFRA